MDDRGLGSVADGGFVVPHATHRRLLAALVAAGGRVAAARLTEFDAEMEAYGWVVAADAADGTPGLAITGYGAVALAASLVPDRAVHAVLAAASAAWTTD